MLLKTHGMTYKDWILAVFVVVGAMALACIGDYPEALKFW
jgi:hypothetical protein